MEKEDCLRKWYQKMIILLEREGNYLSLNDKRVLQRGIDDFVRDFEQTQKEFPKVHSGTISILYSYISPYFKMNIIEKWINEDFRDFNLAREDMKDP